MKKNKNILIGITGGIASYKSCELIRLFVKAKYSVKVMMTEAATKFVSPLVFQELSQNPVYLDMFTPFRDKRLSGDNLSLTGFSLIKEETIQHISLSQWAALCVIAPASANTLSKIAYGICDNLLTTVVSALDEDTKVLLAPAMNENMWKNPILAENVRKLKGIKKYSLMPPEKGELACGVYGEGRMPEVKDIYSKAISLLK